MAELTPDYEIDLGHIPEHEDPPPARYFGIAPGTLTDAGEMYDLMHRLRHLFMLTFDFAQPSRYEMSPSLAANLPLALMVADPANTPGVIGMFSGVPIFVSLEVPPGEVRLR